MTTQTDGEAVLKEMVDGLEGVTPGPWDWLMSGLIRALRDDLAGPLFEVRVPHKKYQRLTKTHVQEVSNGQHIARCSPDNVRAIAAYVDHLQSALKESIRLQGEYASEVERLKAERDAARECAKNVGEALSGVLNKIDWENPGAAFEPDSGCLQCTSGTTPNKHNTGPCAYHKATTALKEQS